MVNISKRLTYNAPSKKAANYVKQNLVELNRKIGKHTIEDFNIPLLRTDRTTRQEISKDREHLQPRGCR